MPIHSCPLPGGGEGYKWGQRGKCFANRVDAERQAEAAYSNGYAGDSDTRAAAGVLLYRDGEVFLAKRADTGTWAMFGGMVEPEDEEFRHAAVRELREESSVELPASELEPIGEFVDGDVEFFAYMAFAPESARIKLCDEHDAGQWFPLNALPEPLHNGIQTAVDRVKAMIPAAMDGLAMDRATTRRYDLDGRMHVDIANISKANVCPYYGQEIPGYQALGLSPDRIYWMYRDPVELARGAATSNNIQLLIKHIAVSANDPKKEYVVGSTGTDAVFDPPYLKNSLVVWDAGAIAGIEEDEQRELSSSYRYVPDMTPGVTADGVRYDGVMRDIVFNHVALVVTGRAGADVSVGDSQPSEFSTMSKASTIAARMAVGAFLRPALANDSATIPLKDLVKPGDKAEAIARRVKQHFKGKFDVDAAKLTGVVRHAMDEAEEMDDPEEDEEEESEEERKKREDEEKKARDKAKDNEEKEPKPVKRGEDNEEKEREKERAEDAARITREVTARLNAEREARELVRPVVGELAAMDSAADVYKHALDTLGVAYDGVPDAGLKAVTQAVIAQQAPKSNNPSRLAMDSNSTKEFASFYGVTSTPAKV